MNPILQATRDVLLALVPYLFCAGMLVVAWYSCNWASREKRRLNRHLKNSANHAHRKQESKELERVAGTNYRRCSFDDLVDVGNVDIYGAVGGVEGN